MPMPPETLKTLQDLEITGAGDTGSQQEQQQQQQDDNVQRYEQPFENDCHAQGQQQQSAQAIHHHPHPATAPHPTALQAHPSEQPHSAHIYPPLLDQHFAFGSDGAIPIDPGLLDARFDHPAASGQGGGGVPGSHQGHPEQQWATAPQPLSSVNMDSFTVSPTSFSQYHDPQASLMPGMSSFEPQISTTWSMDGSLQSTSRGPSMFSSMSVPSNSTPASSRSPGSPGKVGAGLNNQPPSAGKGFSSPGNYPGVQPEPWAGDQPGGKKRRQTVGPKMTARTGTETSRSHRNNSSPGFSTPQVPIAPAPVTVTATDDDNNKSIDNRKGSSSSSSNSAKHAGMTKTTTTTATTAPTTITTTTHNAGGPSEPPQPGPSTTTAPGQPPDPRARNREAANRCRAKSKVAVAELEATERALGSEHEHLTQTARSLRDEVLSLKNELLMHGNCDDDLIQQYLTNSARMVGSGAGTIGGAVGITTTTITSAAGSTLPGLPVSMQPPPPGPSLGGGGGIGGVPSVSSHGGLPAILPSTSSGGPGAVPPPATTTARGRGNAGGRKA